MYINVIILKLVINRSNLVSYELKTQSHTNTNIDF